MSPPARRSVVAGATIAGLAILIAGVRGQAPQQPPEQQAVPILRSGTAAVLVDAYPQRDGRIVSGLTAADFQLFEDGEPQRIETVEFVRLEPSPLDVTRRDPNNTREMYALVADPRRRVFVAFLDEYHTTTTGSNLVRRPLIDTIDRAVGADDLIGVMTARMRPGDVTFGRDRLVIEEQLTRHWTWGQRQRITTDRPDPMEEALRICYHERRTAAGGGQWLVNDGGMARPFDEILIERRREHQTLAALGDLVAHLGSLREARTVVMLVSDGWMLFRPDRNLAELARGSSVTPAGRASLPGVFGTSQVGVSASGSIFAQCAAEAARLADIDSQRDLVDIMQRANRGNVSIYPVATAGLAAFDGTLGDNVTMLEPQGLMRDAARMSTRVSSLRTIAENTDGLAIVQTNDLAAGLRRIADDVSGYYLLGYTPSNTRQDGSFRRIDVKVSAPGVSVRARRGYVARSDAPAVVAPPVPPAATSAGVAGALAALASIPSTAELYATAHLGEGRLVVVAELGGAPNGTAAGRVVVEAQPASGGDVLTGTAEIAPAARGALVELPIPAGVATWHVRVQVATGSRTLLEQVNVAHADDGALLGAPIAFRGRPAPRSPLSPVVTLRYARAERLRLQWSARASLEQVSARLLDRTGRVLAESLPTSRDETGAEPSVLVDLNLAPFARGEYVIEVTARGDNISHVQFVAFRVVQ